MQTDRSGPFFHIFSRTFPGETRAVFSASGRDVRARRPVCEPRLSHLAVPLEHACLEDRSGYQFNFVEQMRFLLDNHRSNGVFRSRCVRSTGNCRER